MRSPCPNILVVILDAISAHPCVFLQDRGCQEEDASVRYKLQASALFCMGPMMALLWSHRFFPTLRCFLLASFPSAGPGSCDRCDVTTHHVVWEVYYTGTAWGFSSYNSCTPYTPAWLKRPPIPPLNHIKIGRSKVVSFLKMMLVSFFSTICSFWTCDTRKKIIQQHMLHIILISILCPSIYLV